jgi:acylaminoacyl-peptidase
MPLPRSVAQFGVRYDFANPPSFAPTGDDHARLVKCSPSSHLVKRLAGSKEPCMPPTLLQLGSADLRVPPNQGLAWYHALKAHGEPVTLLWWPGHGHGLQNEADQPKPFEAVLSFVVERAVF